MNIITRLDVEDLLSIICSDINYPMDIGLLTFLNLELILKVNK